VNQAGRWSKWIADSAGKMPAATDLRLDLP